MYIFLFTVNDKEEFENFKNKDVDGVFTDNPKEIK
jgi:glycerophosphoryl diester phosphodiesterase